MTRLAFKRKYNSYHPLAVDSSELIDEIFDYFDSKDTCNGCKWNYLIDNFDTDTGQRLDSFCPDACYTCRRNLFDNYVSVIKTNWVDCRKNLVLLKFSMTHSRPKNNDMYIEMFPWWYSKHSFMVGA